MVGLCWPVFWGAECHKPVIPPSPSLFRRRSVFFTHSFSFCLSVTSSFFFVTINRGPPRITPFWYLHESSTHLKVTIIYSYLSYLEAPQPPELKTASLDYRHLESSIRDNVEQRSAISCWLFLFYVWQFWIACSIARRCIVTGVVQDQHCSQWSPRKGWGGVERV